jgi:hypothetical protein
MFDRLNLMSVRESGTLTMVRNAILAIVAFGTVGMCGELLLIGHFEDVLQCIPLATAGAALALLVGAAVRPREFILRALQFVMLTYIGAGLTGVTLHFTANAEFQREIDPALSGLALFWKVTEATAPPALAPGIMVQLGLLGLLYTYKHPVFGKSDFFHGGHEGHGANQ